MNIKVDHFFHQTPDSSGAILTLLHAIKAQGDQIMATQAEFDQKMTDLQTEVGVIKTDLADALVRVTAHETAEEATNTALQQQVTDLTTANTALQTEIDALKAAGVDTTKLDAIMADLQGVATGIEGIDPAPVVQIPPA